MAKNKQSQTRIEHPDDFRIDCMYSGLVLHQGRYRRVCGRFVAMDVAYDGYGKLSNKPQLVILLRRKGHIAFVSWKSSSDWVLTEE